MTDRKDHVESTKDWENNMFDTLKNLNAQVGDTVRFNKLGLGSYLEIDKILLGKYFSEGKELSDEPYWEIVKRKTEEGFLTASQIGLSKDFPRKNNKQDGGPSKYYDYPFKDWITVNDLIDYLSQKQWGWRSYIFKDIIKACFRWGKKEGTTFEYDAKKIIYYGVRLLMTVVDKKEVRKYLQTLLDDEQFK